MTIDVSPQLQRVERPPVRLLDRVRAVWHPDEVWLFGSRAQHRARPDSDWDLLVVVPDETSDDLLDLTTAWMAVRDLKIAADVIPIRRSEFDTARRLPGTLVQIATTAGVRIDKP